MRKIQKEENRESQKEGEEVTEAEPLLDITHSMTRIFQWNCK